MEASDRGSRATRIIPVILAITAVAAILIAIYAPRATPQATSQSGDTVQIAKAVCEPSNPKEIGLQGQTTLAERFSGARPYFCNMTPVGNYAGEGGSWRFVTYKACAYYSTTPDPTLVMPGTVVVDMSQPQELASSGSLTSPAMLRSNESLIVDKNRGLLFAGDFTGSRVEVYDLAADCRKPRMIGSLDLRDMTAHEGNLTGDGKTLYYANYTWNGVRNSETGLVAIDVSDPAHPRELARWQRPGTNWSTHGVSVNADGKRAYLTTIGVPVRLSILDTTDVQARRDNPQIRTVGTLALNGTTMGQFASPMMIAGKPYVLMSAIRPPFPVGVARCSADWFGAPFSAPRLIDVSDERNPRPAVYLKLEVNQPSSCAKIADDPTFMGYSNVQCDADNPADVKLLACSNGESGLRIYDVRDVRNVKEVAYFKPRPTRTAVRKGSYFGVFGGVFTDPDATKAVMDAKVTGTYRVPSNDHTADAVLYSKFSPDHREVYLIGADSGFHIVRLSDKVLKTVYGTM